MLVYTSGASGASISCYGIVADSFGVGSRGITMNVVDALRRATEDDVEQAVVEGYFPVPQMSAADLLAFFHAMIDQILSDHVGEHQ